jgi:hypothetical protein
MPQPDYELRDPRDGGGVALRASGMGALIVACLAVLAIVLVPEELLSAQGRGFLWAGAGVGACSGALGNLIVARGGLSTPADPRDGRGFVRALAIDFVLQLVAVLGSPMCLILLEMKFAHVAAFGMALAGATGVFRLAGTLLVARALTHRAGRFGTTSSTSLAQDTIR